MSNTGNYGGDDRTVVMPMPGGRSSPQPGASPAGARQSAGYAQSQTATPGPRMPLATCGINTLLASAAPIQPLITQLRTTITHSDVVSLRQQLADEILSFETRARQHGIADKTLLTAKYVLCAVLDEAVLSTVWGNQSVWATQTLLARFFNETSGGEKFFQILDRLLNDPNPDADLLELMFVCLSLGFQGRYRMADRGQAALDELRSTVFERVRRVRGLADVQGDPLSEHWQGIKDRRNALQRYVPLWVLGSVAAALLVLVYVGFSFFLETAADPVQQQLERLSTVGESAEKL